MTIGIYRILNKVNNKVYIGQSIDVENRLKQYKSCLNRGDHHNPHLQHSWDKYGEDVFEFGIITKCDESELDDLEISFIANYDSFNSEKGYNKETGGDLNKHMSDESCRKISESCKGLFAGDNNPFYGAHHTKENRKKMSELMSGENNPFYGKTHTEENRMKISKAKNTSGFLYVYKDSRKDTKQGFIWRYEYQDKNNKKRIISSVDIKKLEEKVKEKGLRWEEFK